MHPLTAIFRQTLQELLDYLAQFKKREYIKYLRTFIPQVLVTALVAVVFVVVCDFLWGGLFAFQVDQIVMRLEFRNMFLALLILGLGLKREDSVYEGEVAPEGERKTALLNEEASFTRNQRKVTFIFASVLLLVHALLYVNPFYQIQTGIGGLFEAFAPTWGWEYFLYTFIELVKNQLLPLFLATLIVLYRMWSKISLGIIREYRWAYLATFLFLFAFYTLFRSFVEICGAILAVEEGVRLPLSHPTQLLAWSLFVVITFLLLALFYPVFSKSLSFPLKIEDEILAKEELHSRIEFSGGEELPLTGEEKV